ncbi:MAG: hypothetical protein M3209_03850 [Acidobacteriota bacterium]|nr:hypothetical protein [Acidobacteriota bacterium]
MLRLPFLILALCVSATFVTAQTPTSPTTALTPNVSQTKTFGEYSFDVPNATWRVISGAAEQETELIYGDRTDGFLEIRKITTAPDAVLADVIDREQNQKLQFLPNFVNGKEENFKGHLSGKVANYEFTRSGNPMIGRAYFLQADEKTVYVLRFTGARDKLRLIRNQTDSIARTFKVKK